MGVIIDEAGMLMYANHVERYTEFLGDCLDSCQAIVSEILGPGAGLYDMDITEKLTGMLQSLPASASSLRSAGKELAGNIRAAVAEAGEADQYTWQDGGFDRAAAALLAF